MLREAHLRMRWHFERAHFHESKPSGAAFGRVEFINRKFRAMRVAAGIDQQIAE